MGPTRLAVLALAAVCLLSAAWFVAARRDEKRLQRANAVALRGDLRGAITAARQVRGGPALTQAHRVAAYAELALHRPAASERQFRAAARGMPNDWTLRRDLGSVLLTLGHRAAARAQMARALALNPRMPLPAGFVG